MRTVTGVAAVLSLSLAAGAQAQQPPANGGFDTDRCVGRAAKRPANGRLIVRKRGDKVGLHTVNPDGTGMRRLTKPPPGFEDDNPAASPDGRHLSFVRGRYGGGRPQVVRVMVLDLRTGRARQILPEAHDGFHTRKTRSSFFSPTWSPDGRWIAVSDREPPGTVLVHPDGTGAKSLDTGPWLFNHVSWSPNGRCLAGQASFDDRAAWGIVGPEGGEPDVFFPRFCPSVLCTRPTYIQVTHWTRDGRGLIDAVGEANARRKITDIHVIRMNLAGRAVNVIARHHNFPVPSPDGRRLTAWNYSGGTDVFTMSGKRVGRLPRTGVLAWAPRA